MILVVKNIILIHVWNPDNCRVSNVAKKYVNARLRSKKSANFCDLQITFINTSKETVRLEKFKIGPPAIDKKTILYNCFVFDSRNHDEPKWLLKTGLPELQKNDFVELSPGREYGSDWMPFNEMYDAATLSGECTQIKYRAFHEIFWPDTRHESALVIVESNWVNLPKRRKF